MARGPSCGFVDESCGPARALRAVWTSPWTTLTRCPPPRPHSRASRPQAPQDQPPVMRSGCPYRPFDSISASHSNPSQHRLRAGSPTTLQAHFRMGLDSSRPRPLGNDSFMLHPGRPFNGKSAAELSMNRRRRESEDGSNRVGIRLIDGGAAATRRLRRTRRRTPGGSRSRGGRGAWGGRGPARLRPPPAGAGRTDTRPAR